MAERTLNTSWPAIGLEPIEWAPSRPTGRLADIIGGAVSAAVPPFIADETPTASPHVARLVSEATSEIIRFDAELGSEIGPFNAVLLRSEAAASSQIEHLTASSKAILMAEAGDTSRRNATEIAANTAAMTAATLLANEITREGLVSMQQALLSSTQPQLCGWRDGLVWIGGGSSSPRQATYVAPAAGRVSPLIDDLVAFTGRSDIDPLTKALVAHAQFETIHPFADGNGRTGRALIHAMLRRDGMTLNLTVPVSAGMLTDTDRYFAALMAYREGDIDPILEHGATAAFRAITNGRALAADLTTAVDRWRDALAGVRRDAIVWKVIEVLPIYPVIDATSIAERHGVTAPTARTAINQLAERGIVEQANAGLRFRRWIASDVAAALDAFAERAGRRG